VKRSEPLKDVVIRRITPPFTPDWSALVDESLLDGYRHVKRLADDYSSGSNLFDQPGEALFAAFLQDKLAGVGGLNQDPYAEGHNVGRVENEPSGGGFVLSIARVCE
jgi:hypothetical protein